MAAAMMNGQTVQVMLGDDWVLIANSRGPGDVAHRLKLGLSVDEQAELGAGATKAKCGRVGRVLSGHQGYKAFACAGCFGA